MFWQSDFFGPFRQTKCFRMMELSHLILKYEEKSLVRGRPFILKGGGMVFCFVQNFFFEHKSWNFWSRKAQFFFPEFNIRLYDKNSESDYFFFPPPKSEYFFQQHWESEYFF